MTSRLTSRRRATGASAFWPLFRLTLNNTFGVSAARFLYLRQRKRLWEPVLILFGVGAAGVSFGYLLYQVALAFVRGGLALGQPEIAFTFAFLVASVLVLFFGLMAVVSVFYFSTDLEVLVPLPLRPGAILLAKFGTIVVGEYAGVLLAVVPAAVAYAQVAGGGAAYWLSLVVAVAVAPVIPLAIASILAILLMRVINRRHRDILIVLFGAVFSFAVLAFQISVMNHVPEGATADYLQKLLSGQISLVNLIGRAYPPAVWATWTIAAPNAGARLAGLAAYLGVSAAAVWLMAVIGGKFFYAGLIGGTELARRRLSAREVAQARSEAEARMVQTGAVRALFWREWRLFMRVPLYVFNGFAASLIVPVIFGFGFRGVMKDPDMVSMMNAIQATGNTGLFLALGVAALTVLVVAMNTTSSSAVSREGPYFWISKVIPATPEEQIQGKLLFSGAAALVSAAPTLIIFGWAFRMSLVRLVGAAVLSLLASVVAICVGLLVDTARPYLRWTNPQQAVKSNLNVILPLPVVVGLVAGLGALAVWLYRGAHLGELAVMGTLALVLVAVAVPVYLVTVSAAKRLYERLEP